MEISSESGPLFVTGSILNAANREIKPIAIKGRGYEWFSVPPGGVSVQLKSLGVPTAPITLKSGANTFLRVTTISPDKNLDINKDCDLKIFPPEAKLRISSGEKGWVYLGALEQSLDTSAWKSMFLAAADGQRLDRAGIPTLTKKMFFDLATQTKNTFTVDYPLYLRSGVGEVTDKTSSKILRPGQKVKILQLKPNTKPENIYAQVEVL